MKKLYIVSIILTFVFSGCTSVAINHPIKNINSIRPINIYMCIKSTSTENTINKTFSKEKNEIFYKQQINKALKDIQIKFAKAMKSKNFVVKEKCIEKPNSRKNDLKLTIILSGYGSMKKKWKKFLILSGIGEGIVQGIVVNSATHNPWLGLGVAVEEITSEYLTWNGADWFLGETFAPVTLEGELKYKDKIIWQDTFFITENDDELNQKDKKIKAKQLIASLHKAEKKLLESLNKYISNQILKYKVDKSYSTNDLNSNIN